MNVYLSDTLFLLTALADLAAAALFLAHLLASQRVPPRLPIPLLAVGAMLHAAHIVVSSLVLHVCPVEGIHFPMSVVSMLMCVVYLLMRARYRIDVVGAF